MDSLLVLIAVAALAAPVLLIIFMVWTVKLGHRVRALEDAKDVLWQQLQTLQDRREPPTAAAAPAEAVPTPESDAKPESAPEPETRPAAPPAATEAAPGPWQVSSELGETPAPPPERKPYSPPKAVVLRAEKAAELSNWVKANWIYVVSAVSLAAAGIFFVQYGIEAGLLPPTARVTAALIFGAALIVAGEYIRRRWGDREEVATAHLPSVFSSAGIVTLFGAILAALHLYGLISPTLAFIGLVAVAALAIVLGWFSGPLLAAVGLVGANAAPFLVGGESDQPELFYGFFALIAVTGLAIDAGRRWAWVSVLALALVYPASWLLYLQSGAPELFAALLTGMVVATMAIPTLTLSPAHGGATILESFAKGRPRGWPEFPTRLVAASMAASVGSLALISFDGVGTFWLTLICLVILFVAVSAWADRARALEDLAILPAAAIVALPVWQAISFGSVYRSYAGFLGAEEGTPAPTDPYLLTGIAVLVSLVAAWRSRRGARWPIAWAAGAALAAPAMVVGLEATWKPASVLGTYPWAITALAVAGVMTALSLVFAKADGADKARIAGFVLAALAMTTLSLTLVLTETALTLAVAVVTLAAAALDRRFGLRPLSVAVQIGAVALGWRLVIDPGIDWAYDAPYWEIILAYGGTIAALVAALALLRPLGRPVAITVAESAAWTLSAVFASILLARVIDDATPGRGTETHWFAGLLAAIWLAAAANQLWRSQIKGWIRKLRLTLTVIYLVIGLGVLAIALTIFNPALNGTADNHVFGPPFINTLIPAYLVPALVMAFVARAFTFLDTRTRRGFGVVAALLGVFWVFLAIRHFWRGTTMDQWNFTQPELYSYTIALLIAGAGLLYQAIAKRSPGLRKLAMAVIALTVAKVFLVDASDLVGLLRVFSFLALGLVLAGLAFLNRWAAAQIRDDAETTGEDPGENQTD